MTAKEDDIRPALPPARVALLGYEYLWSADQLIEEAPVYADGTVAYEQSIHWLYAPGGLTPVARYENGKLHYVVADHLGTPRELLNEQGKVEWANRLSTWGKEEFWSQGANDEDNISCNLRFPGQYADAESGLHYNRYRYYDTDTGQYLCSDPIGLLGGTNPYSYVHNPNSWIDPLGLATCPKADRRNRHHSTSAEYIKHTQAKNKEQAISKSSGGKPAQYWGDSLTDNATSNQVTAFRNSMEKSALKNGIEIDLGNKGSSYYIHDAGKTIGYNNEWLMKSIF